jgi:hypothetical protein
MEGVIGVTEREVGLPVQKKRKKDSTEKRSEMQLMLVNIVPSKIVDLKAFYFRMLMKPARDFWVKKAFPGPNGIPFPLPQDSTGDWSPEMSGFMLYCVTFSILQLIPTEGAYFPRKLSKEGSSYELDSYFPKFVIFVIVNRFMEKTFSWNYSFFGFSNVHIQALGKYPGTVGHLITSNTRMTTRLYGHIKIKTATYGDFWKAAGQYEGLPAYYSNLFKVEKEVLFPVPL